MIKNSQKGISLVITIPILMIVLIIVVAVGMVFGGQIRESGRVEDSVKTFFAADTGIERTLFIERKKGDGGRGGICNICDYVPNCSMDGADCDTRTCTDCEFEYYDYIENRKYTVKGRVRPVEEDGDYFLKTTLYSTGELEQRETKRTIETHFLIERRFTPPQITNAYYNTFSTEDPDEIEIEVTAEIISLEGVDPLSVIALIYNQEREIVDNINLELVIGEYDDGIFEGRDIFPDDEYIIRVRACNRIDTSRCSEYRIEE